MKKTAIAEPGEADRDPDPEEARKQPTPADAVKKVLADMKKAPRRNPA
jgi:hypothetical protein